MRAETLDRVVDRHPARKAGETLGCRHVQDAVQIEVEPDNDLVTGLDVSQAIDLERPDEGVIPRIFVLALEDADISALLAVGDRREDLGAAWRAGGCYAQ